MYPKLAIKLKYSHHRDQEVVLIKFDYNKGLISKVKRVAGSWQSSVLSRQKAVGKIAKGNIRNIFQVK